MKITDRTWDIAIYAENNGLARIGFPRAISRGLKEKGYNRARLEVTEEGLLLVPYAGSKNGNRDEISLPDWTNE